MHSWLYASHVYLNLSVDQYTPHWAHKTRALHTGGRGGEGREGGREGGGGEGEGGGGGGVANYLGLSKHSSYNSRQWR